MSPTTADRQQTDARDAAAPARDRTGEDTMQEAPAARPRAEPDDMRTAAMAASGGCGNPAALADLVPGETVLDLGSGGGIDVLFAASRVGRTGKVYGLEATDEMLELARACQAQLGIVNAEFLKGAIDRIPLPDGCVDVVLSNGAMNLSADKPRVLSEAFRVLRPGGRLSVSDTLVRGPFDIRLRRRVAAWIGCLADALEEERFRGHLAAAGFEAIEVEPARIYAFGEMSTLLANSGDDAEAVARAAAGRYMSALVRARKSGRLVQESAPQNATK